MRFSAQNGHVIPVILLVSPILMNVLLKLGTS